MTNVHVCMPLDHSWLNKWSLFYQTTLMSASRRPFCFRVCSVALLLFQFALRPGSLTLVLRTLRHLEMSGVPLKRRKPVTQRRNVVNQSP